MPIAALKKPRHTDSPRISRSTRLRRQPSARKTPISWVRSNTAMIMVLSIPTDPSTRATTVVAQAITLTSRICTSRSNIVSSRGRSHSGNLGFDPLAQRGDRGRVGRLGLNDEAGDLALPGPSFVAASPAGRPLRRSRRGCRSRRPRSPGTFRRQRQARRQPSCRDSKPARAPATRRFSRRARTCGLREGASLERAGCRSPSR